MTHRSRSGKFFTPCEVLDYLSSRIEISRAPHPTLVTMSLSREKHKIRGHASHKPTRCCGYTCESEGITCGSAVDSAVSAAQGSGASRVTSRPYEPIVPAPADGPLRDAVTLA